MKQVINIENNINMKDKIDKVDATFVQVGAVSPAGPTAQPVKVR